MHLERPNLTTTSTRKRKVKVTKAAQQELERGWRERNQWLKEIHLPKETFEQYLEWVYGKGTKTKSKEIRRPHSKAIAYPTTEKKSETIYSSDSDSPNKIIGQIEKTINEVESNRHGKLWVTGAVSSKPSPTYTGSKIIGIATMHKSNMVPIFNDEAAKDVAKMRR